MTDLRISTTQKEVINLMQEGWLLTEDCNFWLSSENKRKKCYITTFNFLHDKGIIKLHPKQNFNNFPREYVLTYFGENLKL